jgi:hypothetical protein
MRPVASMVTTGPDAYSVTGSLTPVLGERLPCGRAGCFIVLYSTGQCSAWQNKIFGKNDKNGKTY